MQIIEMIEIARRVEVVAKRLRSLLRSEVKSLLYLGKLLWVREEQRK